VPTHPVPESELRARLDLLDLERRVRLLTGADSWGTHADPEVGLRRILLSDGPVGVRGPSWDERDTAVNIPSPTALAASWDEQLAERMGRLLAAEARRKGVDVVLAPTVNLHRSPFAGRHFECLSEDPWLSGWVAAAYVRGLQAGGVAGCAKHFVANDSETERFRLDARLDERTLRELYLLPFEVLVREAGVWSVMAAYTGLNGVTMSEHPALHEVLAEDWGFDGVVVSDWLAARTTEPTAGAGLDLVMPGPAGPWGPALVEAVRAGRVPAGTVADKALRLLRLAARVGALDGVPPAAPPPEPVAAEDAAALVREAAAAGFVLVRNEGVLPADPAGLGSVAVLGPNAEAARTLGGGSAVVHPPYTVSPLAGLRAALGDRVEVRYARGVGLRSAVPALSPRLARDPQDGSPGVRVWFWGRGSEDGAPALGTEHRDAGSLAWAGEVGAGLALTEVGRIGVHYRFTAPGTGEYWLGCAGTGRYRLTVDGRVLFAGLLEPPADVDAVDHFVHPPTGGGALWLAAGTEVEVLLEHLLEPGCGYVRFRVVLAEPEPDPDEELRQAVALAEGADLAVVVVGTTEEVESEGFDRGTLALPGRQDELVRAVAAVNPRTVVVVNSGAPVLLPWAEEVAAVLLCWFPGQEFGNALADVLLGLCEPGGRLPTTWPVDERAPLPSVRPDQGVLPYTEGLHVGYRRFARDGVEPRYWFGHGLGYTTWELADVECPAPPDPAAGLRVRVTARNTGRRPGREVLLLYLGRSDRPDGATDRPVRWLAGYAAVTADPGAEVRVEIPVPARALAVWDPAAHGWVVEPGWYRVSVARSAGEEGVGGELELAGCALSDLRPGHGDGRPTAGPICPVGHFGAALHRTG
jgi:beta-glucosidase